jgi:hypothetical protein
MGNLKHVIPLRPSLTPGSYLRRNDAHGVNLDIHRRSAQLTAEVKVLGNILVKYFILPGVVATSYYSTKIGPSRDGNLKLGSRVPSAFWP